MSEEKKAIQAKAAFAAMCQMLDAEDWRYQKDEEKLIISCGARGEDIPMDITIKVDEGRQVILLLSRLPFAAQENKRLDFAVAISAINHSIVDGSFDYDIKTGNVYFRMTNSYMDSSLSPKACGYLLYCACKTIDQYNDKLLMLAKGMISLEQFIAGMK